MTLKKFQALNSKHTIIQLYSCATFFALHCGNKEAKNSSQINIEIMPNRLKFSLRILLIDYTLTQRKVLTRHSLLSGAGVVFRARRVMEPFP